jgi:hypothetical protein
VKGQLQWGRDQLIAEIWTEFCESKDILTSFNGAAIS